MKSFHRALCLLLTLSLLLGTAVAAFAADEEPKNPDDDAYVTSEDGCYLMGDIDLDGKTAAADARHALRAAVGLDELNEEEALRADLDNDEAVTASDARLILRLAVKLDPLPEHIPAVLAAVEASCTEGGLTAGAICKVCKRVLTAQEETPPLGHDWGGWKAAEKATCTEDGEDARKCSRCFEEETRIVMALGHVAEAIPAVAATCTEAGKTEGEKCARCGEILTAPKDVPALGHAWSEWRVDAAATCDKDGRESRLCARCSETETRAIPATGVHTFGDWTETKAPTCVEKGEKTRACAVCGEKQTREVPATGVHTYGEWTETKAPTCVEKGEKTRTCSVCGATETEEVPATGVHTFGDWTETKAPTCVEKGEKTRTCAVCGATETDEVPATGVHTFGDWTETKAPTCTEKGEETRSCSVCGATETRETEALGHDLADDDAVEATWTENAIAAGKHCTRCDYTEGGEEIENTSKLYLTMEDANAQAAEAGIDHLIKGDADGADATVTVLADGLMEELDLNESYFDGLLGNFKQALAHFLTADDVVTFDGEVVYQNGKFQNTALKNALFNTGKGFFYRLANLSDDGVFGAYDVQINDEAINLTVKVEGSDENLAKLKAFAAKIAEHVSATVDADKNLVIDLKAPDKLKSLVAEKLNGRDLNDQTVAAALSVLKEYDLADLIGSHVGAMNKLCGFLCGAAPILNKALDHTDVKVQLADGETLDLFNGTPFEPETKDYAGLLDALTYMLGDELLMTKLGAFRNANGVYTIPVIITADVSDSGLMEGGTIAETVIVNLHLFD